MSKCMHLVAVLAAIGAFAASAAQTPIDHTVITSQGYMQTGSLIRVASDAGAEADGVIHSVDENEGVVNLTHGPIPTLSWPSMTMDLPVADGVDLSDVQPGDKVRFRVVLGADQVYRITAIEPAP
jgi:Cu/Ag efflux protein CusF